jgi:hypothetical protein
MMLSAFLKAALSVILNSFFKLFGINRDEQIGALKEANKAQGKALQDAEQANRVDNLVDNDRDGSLLNDLNNRD